MKPEYIEKLREVRDKCRAKLEASGMFVEDASDEVGLTISLTKFGLETIYATLPQSEMEYILDNEVEL